MASLVETDFDKIKKVIDINLVGTMLVNNTFHPLLKEKGRILIVTSEVAGFDPMPFNGLYNVSKTGLESYAQALRQELNLIDQKVITIRPGAIETPLASFSMDDTKALADQTKLYEKQASKFYKIARKFMGTPIKAEKIAKIIYKAATCKHPKIIYKKHQNLGLVLLNLLPLRLQCFVIKMLLK
jgi:NAD(P)-dependent dehydrogenase (short-subunit alcohol dehydrogenase family)